MVLNSKEHFKKRIISCFIVFMLIGSIYLISPNNARGVIVQINDLAPEYEKGDQIEIIADIIIESGESIPIDHMLLEIAGASSTNASFNVDGSNISVPSWITITLLSEFNPDYGYGYGYGYYYYDYGYRYGYDHNYGYGYGYGQGFDFGYGYGYLGILKYRVTIDSSFLNTGNHTMQLHAYTGNIIHQKFSSVMYSFNIRTADPIPHLPIRINSNADFDEAHGVANWETGDGSQGNPWIIENYDINGTGYGYCIYVGNTTEHFIVRDCLLHNASGQLDIGYWNFGLTLYNVVNGMIDGNKIVDNYHGIYLGISNTIVIKDNKVHTNNFEGVYLTESNNNSIIWNNISSNVWGIHLDGYNSGNDIQFNSISNNSFAGMMIIIWSDNNTIAHNNVSNNDNGIYLLISNNNTIHTNLCYNNGYGIRVSLDSNNNMLYHNNLIDNTNQAYDDGTNFWDNGYPSGGNYWSDYTGVDFNSTPSQDVPPPDGIGDTPYIDIQGGSGAQDNYPLMEPFSISTVDIVLSSGWNLISLPLIQTDEYIIDVLSSISGKWDYVQAYNATDPDHWKTYSIYKPSQLNDLLSLDHTMGFWINITEPNITLAVQGAIPTSTSIPLYAGWNLVGYPTLNATMEVSDALFGTGADRVMVCDTSEPYNIREVGPTYIMQPGEGYWIHVPADSIWTINW